MTAPSAEALAARIVDRVIYHISNGYFGAGAMANARSEVTALLTQVQQAAISGERERCSEIASLARFGEIDQDFRAIIHIIDGGASIEQIKTW